MGDFSPQTGPPILIPANIKYYIDKFKPTIVWWGGLLLWLKPEVQPPPLAGDGEGSANQHFLEFCSTQLIIVRSFSFWRSAPSQPLVSSQERLKGSRDPRLGHPLPLTHTSISAVLFCSATDHRAPYSPSRLLLPATAAAAAARFPVSRFQPKHPHTHTHTKESRGSRETGPSPQGHGPGGPRRPDRREG